MNRQAVLSHLEKNSNLDVLIIGGGVNGIGTFRDLAFQGVNVLLVERKDFCSGASAASSHMLHGGIRYLENGEFRLVREALHERNLLLKNAPHYAKPLPTTIPIFKWFSGLFNAPLKFLGILEKPSERGGIVIKLGLMMYDLFARSQQTMPNHSFHTKSNALKHHPKLNAAIVCSATYFDAYMPYPERLCLDLIRDATEKSPNAHALNYCQVVDGDKNTVTMLDEISGKTFSVSPKVVINAAGPWIDFVNQAIGNPTEFIGGTKGSHLILDNPQLYEATGGSEIFFESEDGRIVLIFPYMGKVMIGTTDIRIDDPEQAVCSDEEIDYILGLTRRVFPTITIDRSQIVFTFCGVRPLPSSKDKRTGTISRDHSIETIPAGAHFSFPIHSLIGGKWTTFRAFSEQATDAALSNLQKSRQLSTSILKIGGGNDFPTTDTQRNAWLRNVQSETELELTHLSMLLDRYGTYAQEISKFMSQENDAPLLTLPHYTKREITFLAQHESVHHVDDFMLRRSLVAMLGHNSKDIIHEVAQVLGEALSWSPAQIAQEVDRTVNIFAKKYRVEFQ
jgi:glycerol-3-phosphate dehydrogenase